MIIGWELEEDSIYKAWKGRHIDSITVNWLRKTILKVTRISDPIAQWSESCIDLNLLLITTLAYAVATNWMINSYLLVFRKKL